MTPSNIVIDGVVEQVGDESLDEIRIAFEGRRRNGGLNPKSKTVDTRTFLPKDRLRENSEIDGFVTLHSPFAIGEGQESFDQGFLLSVGCEELVTGGSPYVRGRRVIEGNLQQGSFPGQRRPQFVGRVCHEVFLPRRRLPQGAQTDCRECLQVV